MAYSVSARKLKRVRSQRRALMKIMASNLILKERIKTTEAKAKTVRPFVERLITIAKKDSVASRRRLHAYLPKRAADAMVSRIAPQYKERHGGYTRIVRVGPRKSDRSEMVFLEFVK